MKMIPCKLCPTCGRYSSINVTQCPCGTDLTALAGAAMDYNRISPDKYGQIDADMDFYVRRCPACNTEHFFTEISGSVRICRSCRRAQIAYQPTELYISEEEKKADTPKAPEIPAAPVVPPAASTPAAPAESPFSGIRDNVSSTLADDDDDGDGSGFWGGLILGNATEPRTSPNPDPPVTPVSRPKPAPAPDPSVPAGVSTLTATALHYGNLTFTLRSDSTKLPYLLGRSANHAEFLRQDPRVGNEHCYLSYRGGSWMVIERLARNGTAVNGIFLAEGGSQVLHNGDELKLGHHPDSMAFRITIR